MSLAMDCDVSLADHNVQSLLPAMARADCCPLQYYDKYVSRTMRCLPDKFIELCHMHLAFLLDLSGDKLELLLSGHDEHKKKKLGLPSVGMFKRKDKSHHGLFGHPLTDEGVCLMMPLIKFLKMEKNVTKEGLFRKPGNKSRMTTLKQLLIAQGPALSIDPEVFSPNDVACVLKEFVRELPEPLLTERHLEAHRQILALGQHAKTPEDISRYSSRKLSALQLLMLLLPPPVQKLTMNLVQLLQRIADSPESKMTSSTLGTIFAPMFFIERKVQPRDLYCQITTTAPAVSFMIDKAHELFKPPKELVMDLSKFWNSLGQASLQSDNKQSCQMQKSLSGQTLYTNVCYADRELSKCEDVASNTQAELANLLAHMQTLPNTPHCAKLKKQILKSVDTPEFCSGLRRRSRSIGASIKKRLPVLGRLMNRQGESSASSASSSSSSDSKTETSARTRLFECQSQTLDTRRSLQVPKPGHKRHYISENCPTALATSNISTPVKQKCQETTTCKITLTVTVNRTQSIGSGCEALHTPSRHSITVNRTHSIGSGCKAWLTPDRHSVTVNRTQSIGSGCEALRTPSRHSITVNRTQSIGSGCEVRRTPDRHSVTVNQTQSIGSGCEARRTPSRHSITVNRTHSIGSGCEARRTPSRHSITVNRTHSIGSGCEVRRTPSRHSITVNRKHSVRTSCEDRHSINVVSDFLNNRTPSSVLQNPATCDIKNKENKEDPVSGDFEIKTSSASQISQHPSGPAHTKASTMTAKVSSSCLDQNSCFQSETRIDYLPHVDAKQITMSTTASRNSTPVTNTRKQPFRKQGTPVMTRAALRVIQNNILESSF